MLAYDLIVVLWRRTGELNFRVMGNDRLKRIEVVLVEWSDSLLRLMCCKVKE